ncbi:MAG: tRNA pseudouridine(13) synthase TruD [Proteobacteria bacterium]|nr:tRNA pseudouridine(13) synthase TruD [Pseudomonadota bacterium]
MSPPRALSLPRSAARFRVTAEDFLVEEELGFAPSGAGSHLLLKVRKVNANTVFVARALARAARCREHEVGYAGLKDRKSVAVQWFSVPRPRVAVDFAALSSPEFQVLEAHPHARKLPRGALAGNRFRLRLRPAAQDSAPLAARLQESLAVIARRGVPNYFGPQRFGREGGNLAALHGDPLALPRPERGFVLSAARSLIFNALLAERVRSGGWEALTEGDLAMLDGRGSFFAVEHVDDTLLARAAALEIHPSGALWGEGDPQSAGAVRELELRTALDLPHAAGACRAAGMEQERRALRLRVLRAEVALESDAVVLSFALTRGAFATAVLRELIEAGDELPEA